ncbi:MAG: histidine phosphatase family protein [Asticcacaulis sp.]
MTIQTVPSTDPATGTRPSPIKPGAITLVRHGEPALSRRVKLDSAGYRNWWAAYELGGLLEGQTPPRPVVDSALQATVRYASTRKRALETAKAICGELCFEPDPLFIEAPLPPPNFPSFMKFSPGTWGVIARFWWWAFDHHEGQETRKQAEARAIQAADKLIQHALTGQNVMLMAHGYFNGMIGLELARRGWTCVHKGGFKYWSRLRFEKKA